MSDPLETGFAEQQRRLAEALASGMARAGWKVGLNVPAVQARLGLRESALGWLRGDRVLESGAEFAAPAGARVHVEAELALRLGSDVPGDAPPERAAAAIEAVAPALELVDYALDASGVEAMLAHSMFHCATVLGAPLALERAAGAGQGWPRLEIDGQPVAEPHADLVPPPGELVAFAARFLARRGARLLRGDWLLSGSFTDPRPLAPGARAVSDHGPLGRVTIALTADPRAEPGP